MMVTFAPFSIFVPDSIIVVRALTFVTDPFEKNYRSIINQRRDIRTYFYIRPHK